MKKVIKVRLFLLLMLGAVMATGCAKPVITETQDVSSASNVEQASSPNTKSEEQEGSKQDTTPAKQTAVLVRIHFDYDQYTLSDEALKILADNARIMKSSRDMKIVIEGHCDSRGSDEYNIALGARRAQAVKDYLVSQGVDPKGLETISYGEEMPVDRSMNEQAWAMNRRAEFKKTN